MRYLCAVLAASIASVNAYEPILFSFDKRYGSSMDDASSQPYQLFKRDSTGNDEISLDLTNQKALYTVQMNIGTPPQQVTVQLDTGSSDLWVMAASNPFCEGSSSTVTPPDGIVVEQNVDCTQFGVFDPSKSSTFKRNNTVFSISYGDTTFAMGPWAQDKLSVGSLNLDGLTFGVGTFSNSTNGVLGIGLAGLESTNNGNNDVYNNLPLLLKQQGAIDRVVYSLYLNEPTASQGNILFGAVDTAKFSGNLFTLPLVNTLKTSGYNSAIQFDITLQGLGFIDNHGAQTTFTTSQATALLDCGTTLSVFPSPLLKIIANKFNAQFSQQAGLYLMNCPASTTNEFFVFDFGGFQINVPLSSFILPAGNKGVCALAIQPDGTQDGTIILGDNFLSAAYVVYDLENLEVSMAQAVFTDQSNIQVVSDAIPSAVKAAGYSSTWAGWATASSAPNDFTTGGDIFTVSSTSSSSGFTSTNSSATSTGNGSSAGPTTLSGSHSSGHVISITSGTQKLSSGALSTSSTASSVSGSSSVTSTTSSTAHTKNGAVNSKPANVWFIYLAIFTSFIGGLLV